MSSFKSYPDEITPPNQVLFTRPLPFALALICLLLNINIASAQTASDITIETPQGTELSEGKSFTIRAEVTGFGSSPIFRWDFLPLLSGFTLSGEDTNELTITVEAGTTLSSAPNLPFLFVYVQSAPDAQEVSKAITLTYKNTEDVPRVLSPIPDQVLRLSDGPQTLNIRERFSIPDRFLSMDYRYVASTRTNTHLNIFPPRSSILTIETDTITENEMNITLTPKGLGNGNIRVIFGGNNVREIRSEFQITVVNDGPVLHFNDDESTEATIDAAENKNEVATIIAANRATTNNINVPHITYNLSGGADRGLFTIDTHTGILQFKSPPDYENPASAATSNTYKVIIRANLYSTGDRSGTPHRTASQAVAVTVTDVELPGLTPVTTAATAITSTTATFNGNITSDGGAEITERGFVYATSDTDLTIDAMGVTKEVVSGTDLGVFTENITGLAADTKYFYKAYATSSTDTTTYAGEQSFTTSAPVAPTTSTAEASAITSSTATLNGHITSDGGAAITARGFVYAISNADLTIENTAADIVIVSGTTGTFNSAITSLTAGTAYFYTAYAINSVDTTYGGEQSFTTLAAVAPTAPTTSTAAASTITSTTATLNGNITSDGGATITARGFVYATSNADLTIENTAADTVIVSGTTGTFNSAITGLTAGTTYYYRAYATNSVDTTYGGEQSFTTEAAVAVAPTSSTTAASNITSTTATLNGNITSDGGAAITARGFVYATSNTGLIIGATGVTNVTVNGTTGTFNSAITSLTAGTKYYYRAYATNSVDTTYGAVQSFTTTTEAALSIEDFELAGISISPNPTSGILNITSVEKANYRLLNMKGQVLKKGTLTAGKNKIDISSFAKGVYLLKINTSKGRFTKKVVRDH